MLESEAYEDTYRKERAVYLTYGKYSAIVLPDVRGNLISFRNEDKRYTFLRESSLTQEDYKSMTYLHDNPVLFPSKRDDLLISSLSSRTEHIYGNDDEKDKLHFDPLVSHKWEVLSLTSNEKQSSVRLQLKLNESLKRTSYCPHALTFTQTYHLSKLGLTHHFTAMNHMQEPVTFSFAFQLMFNLLFARGSLESDVSCTLSLGQRWEFDSLHLPTGRILPLDKHDLAFRMGKGKAYLANPDNCYTALPVNGKNAFIVHDRRINTKFVYEVDAEYKYWTLYNEEANGSFFCVVPQTSLLNASNLDLPLQDTGLIVLAPSSCWSATIQMYEES